MHRQVALNVIAARHIARTTLEIGAGTLNQLPFEPEVGPYNIVEPLAALYSDSPVLSRIRSCWSDIADVPVGNTYDRITSIAAFEHLCSLPSTVASCGLLLAPGGTLRVAIPSEGTLLWELGWKMTTGLEFRLTHGLDYGALMRHEHVNTAREIREVLHYFFSDVNGKSFGLVPSLSLYQFYVCASPMLKRCEQHRAAVDRA